MIVGIMVLMGLCVAWFVMFVMLGSIIPNAFVAAIVNTIVFGVMIWAIVNEKEG